ncbi:MAG: enoyl-CoA hydratase/isomerase family protein [Myxococcales bacterium]|nr:enoyl-CoA hydratase/isomerase family protein [Myxococcales bacterium]
MSLVLLDRHEGLWSVTLNIPEKLNTISVEMSYELDAIFAEAESDAAIRALIITGSGRAFCAGGNLRPNEGVYDTPETPSMERLLGDYYRRVLRVRQLPVPTIASINGYALGAGLCLALACDVRFVATSAKLGFNFAKLGLHPGMGATYLLSRTVGYARAAELFFSGELFSAERALALGLVNRVFGDDELSDGVLAWARGVASGSLPVIRATKETLRAALHTDFEALLDREGREQASNFTTRDFQEGIRAVFEKRAPTFEDR